MGDHWVEIPLKQITSGTQKVKAIFSGLKVPKCKGGNIAEHQKLQWTVSFNAKVSNIHTEMLVVLDIYFDLINMYV